MKSFLFGAIDVRAFLRQYWQKRPLLLRAALSSRPRFSAKELIALASAEEVESRLVIGNRRSSWRVEYGPFARARFSRLPSTSWTLLVQDVDKHLPYMLELLAPFSGFPGWRVDDVMVSHAVPGGSVGPHVDNYDVFLVQLHGKRRWQLSHQADHELVPDAELKLLRRFAPEAEYVVEAGDVLYLPPGVAHYGVAVTSCLTASVGFRAPSQQELLIDFLEEVSSGSDSALRYADPDLQPTRDPHELRASELSRLRRIVRGGITLEDERIDDFVGRYLTRLKPNLELLLASTSPGEQATAEHGWVRRHHASRWLYWKRAGEAHWFVNGVRMPLARAALAWMHALASGRTLDLGALRGKGTEGLRAALFACHALEACAAPRPPALGEQPVRASVRQAAPRKKSAKRARQRSAASRRTR
jgi:50S ribosomal protein L16 3-hydroxylase